MSGRAAAPSRRRLAVSGGGPSPRGHHRPRLVIVANRVPNPRERAVAAGGLAVALQDAVTGREALWFGWSGRCAEETAAAPQVARHGRVTYATLDLGQEDYRRYYQGFSNGSLWPVLHYRLGLTLFTREDYIGYRAVNAAFARALRPLLRPDDTVWVHDFHLFPLGAELRAAEERHGGGGGPAAAAAAARPRIGFFLHVPFPPAGVFGALPKSEALLADLAAYDVIGVQTEDDAANLREALRRAGEPEAAQRVGAWPAGIDAEGFAAMARRAAGGQEASRLRTSLVGRSLVLGVDRLDYTKGLPQRFSGYGQLLERFPQHRSAVTYLQVAPVSREDVAQYRALRRELDELSGRINGQHAEFDWVPLRWITRTVPRTTLSGFMRIARVGLVTPLRDGMNLVAKEYVAAQDPENPGVLVLSRFAGVAGELDGAVVLNPLDPDAIAEALDQALTMPADERADRWRRMEVVVRTATAQAWCRNFLAALEGGSPAPAGATAPAAADVAQDATAP